MASIELDAFKSTKQDGEFQSDNYNLIVTVMDAKSNYLKNTIFNGDIVYNKNNEDPANFIFRLKSLKKALPNDDLARSSNYSISQSGQNINLQNSLSADEDLLPTRDFQIRGKDVALKKPLPVKEDTVIPSSNGNVSGEDVHIVKERLSSKLQGLAAQSSPLVVWLQWLHDVLRRFVNSVRT